MDIPLQLAGACHILWICVALLVHLITASEALGSHHYSRSLDKVHGPLCYNCHGADGPDTCTDIKICSVEEVCMLHGMTSSAGTQSYEASCQSEMMCTMIGQMQMTQVGKRAATPCHVCCSDDFCNNDCAANNKPPVTPTGSVDTRLLCYSCSLMENPSACRHHVTCALGQMCIIRETGVSIFGAKQYQSACENKEVCHTLQTLNSVKSPVPGHSFCSTCCSNDLCNSHCDYHTTMTSPTTTTTSSTPSTTTSTTTPVAPTKPLTHPTTTVKNGPNCWSCSNMSAPAACNHMVMCAAGEVCTLYEVIDPGSHQKHYEASCQLKELCEKYYQLLDSHFGHGQFCKTCCETDGCNDLCPVIPPTPVPTTHAPTTHAPLTHAPTTPTHHGTTHTSALRCYDCSSVSYPSRCQNTAMCGNGQVCMLHELIPNGQQPSMYTASCKTLQICQYVGQLLKSNGVKSGKEYCHMCCTDDLCNNACPSHAGATTPPTHAPTTTHHALTTMHHEPTTHRTDQILICYSCSVLDDPTSCHHFVPCLPGEVCTIHQIGNHVGTSGTSQYTASCERKQLCTMYSNLAKTGNSPCHTCCDTHLCNNHCDPQPTTAAHVTTVPTTKAIATPSPTGSHGPLECYSCPIIHDPSGCPNTEVCDAGQVCMLHEKSSSGAGTKYYEASCERKVVCESVVRVLNTGNAGHGHMFCTYCCDTSRCNNHCEMAPQTTSLPVVDGQWSDWGLWSVCSPTCGASGQRLRTRTCDNPAPQHHGSMCRGESVNIEQCTMQSCPVDGAWSSWTGWSACTKSCGPGVKIRTRSCDHPAPQYGGQSCVGSSYNQQHCTVTSCPVDGAWSLWGDWSGCSRTCGSGGQQTRTRACDNPAPQHNGATCTGNLLERITCTLQDCPMDGAWSLWGDWSSCSRTCGSGGQQTRTRACDNPTPQHNGATCTGNLLERKTCTLEECPSSQGPLECYSCGLMYEPYGCSHTQTCDPGEICMLHEKSSSMSGTKYYEASCERSTVCESVVRVVNSGSLGQGHVFCTYCCNTSRCNNHCELPSMRAITTPMLAQPTTSLSPREECQVSSYNFVESVGLCFKIIEVINTYPNAIDVCQQESGSLAIITSDVEWKLISFQLKLLTRVSGMSLYMGGYDVYHNGSYYWPDGSDMVYAHWAQGEPRLMKQNHAMPCVVIDMADMTWRTDDCRSRRPFICSKHVH